MAIQGSCYLRLKASKEEDVFDCSWTLNDHTPASEKRSCRTIDVILKTSSHRNQGVTSLPDLAATRFLSHCVQTTAQDSNVNQPQEWAVKIVLPTTHGFIARSDILERRLEGYQHIMKVEGFLKPRQQVSSLFNAGDWSDVSLESLLSRAVGGILTTGTSRSAMASDMFAAVEAELDNRMSIQWVSSEPIEPKRLAWVEGRPDFDVSRRMYEAAWALGIDLVIIENHGHWLSDNNASYAYLREAFIATDINVDSGFVDRIVDAIRSYDKPIHGIMSVSDARGPGVARACEILRLPSSPYQAYILAADKYKTRMMEASSEESFRVFSTAELLDRLRLKDHPKPHYPLMVKPCMGWGSECTSKVHDQSELVQAVVKASERHKTSPQHRTDVLVEPYIDGPEVDANIVLLNKRVLFFEASDDFPKPGDDSEAHWNASFLESMNLVPSALPANELAVVRDSIRDSIVRQGFSSGTFHCEGRIRYSSMHYTLEGGVQDIRCNALHAVGTQAEFYLHEINARPVGYPMSVATHLTYGVDYYALQLLFSIGDDARLEAFSRPFTKGAQWWLAMVFIPEDREGTMKSENPGQEMLERVGELERAVPYYKVIAKKGASLQGPKAASMSFLAYFQVVSRKSREDALRLADLLRKEFKYETE